MTERDHAIEAIGRMIMRWQDATQKFDEMVGKIYDLNISERLCLSFLFHGPQTASSIAQEINLTPPAVTALIDRLERRGFVRRRRDEGDRRKVLIEAAEKTGQLTTEVYQPVADAGAAMLANYTAAELQVLQRVLAESIALQQKLTEDLSKRQK
jgi:DNA-binding MarR family transcriptional regulator